MMNCHLRLFVRLNVLQELRVSTIHVQITAGPRNCVSHSLSAKEKSVTSEQYSNSRVSSVFKLHRCNLILFYFKRKVMSQHAVGQPCFTGMGLCALTIHSV